MSRHVFKKGRRDLERHEMKKRIGKRMMPVVASRKERIEDSEQKK